MCGEVAEAYGGGCGGVYVDRSDAMPRDDFSLLLMHELDFQVSG